MDNQEKILELQKIVHEKQNTFVYYIAGLSAAAIGFTVTQTENDKLDITYLFLGISLFCWGASIFCSLQFIQIKLQFLVVNADTLNAVENKEISIEESYKLLKNLQKDKTKRSESNFMWLQYWFYIALLLFLVWSAFQMSNKLK